MEIHGSYLLLYGVGIVLMIVNIIQSICRPKGKFFNPPQMEEKRDDKTVFRMRLLYAVSQGILLIAFVFCAFNFQNYAVAIIGLTVGNILPIVLVMLYDSFLNIQENKQIEI
ncbi:MAG TPA: hypothetical protein DEO89_03390 [Lachnospiraceae bacterium]|nr:hypothetical protein [Lachnospiraceae bacterium]